ncbi:MAG TPA: hypothetical protein VJH21_00610 [Candidatus Paceibacterota bacterium]
MSVREKILAVCQEDAGIPPSAINEIVGILGVGEWNDMGKSKPHPYGNPVSLPVVVMVDVNRVDVSWGSKRQWCRTEDGIPEGMIDTDGRHEAFLNLFFHWKRGGCVAHVPII